MNWLDRLKRKGGRPDGPAVPGSDKQQGTDRAVGGTVVRAPANQAPTIAKPGIRFRPNEDVTADLQIKNLLGSGAMGEVYLARQRLWDVDIALKIPNDEIVSDPKNRHRIIREAEEWTNLGLHPNIAYCHYAQHLGELLLLVIEYADGGNLRDWIRKGLCADLKTGLDLAIQFCHGLEHAHKKGLVHRDIKPENVLLMKEGTLKITDFGIVRKALAGSEVLQSSGAVRQAAAAMTVVGIGTPDYMAPEQWGDPAGIDIRTDIFAFGICLYEMLCGARPYPMTAGLRQEAADPGRLRGGKGLPARLCRLMRRCVDWDRVVRPATAKEVRAELCAVYQAQFGEASIHAELPEISILADDWNNRALTYLALGREAEAGKAWETALGTDPLHVESTYNYGLHRWRKGQATDDDLIRSMRAVCDNAGPSAWLPKYLLAQVHKERGDHGGVREALAEISGPDAAQSEVLNTLLAIQEISGSGCSERQIEVSRGTINDVSISVDGRYALSAHDGWEVRLWDLATGTCLRTFKGHTSEVTSACFSADGRHVLSGSKDTTLRLWEAASGQCLQVFEGDELEVTSVCLSADGQYALSGNQAKDVAVGRVSVKLWDVATGRCLKTIEEDPQSTGIAVCLSADGKYALSGGYQIRLWEVSTGRCIRTFERCKACIHSITLSVDGQHALSGSYEGVQLWEVATGHCVRRFSGHAGNVGSVSLSASGKRALSTESSGTLRIWDVTTGRCLRTFHDKWSQTAYLSADGKLALSASYSELKLYHLGEFQCDAPFRLSKAFGTAAILSVAAHYQAAISQAQQALTAGDNVKALGLLRVARELEGHERAVAGVEKWAELYVRLRKRGLRTCWPQWSKLSGSSVSSLCLSNNGRLALSGSGDSLSMWDVASGDCLLTFKTQMRSSVCLKGDGRYALSGGAYDHLLKLWDTASGKCVQTFEGHTGSVNSVCLVGDGRYALSGSGDKTIKVWDVASGRCLRTLEGHTGAVTSVCVNKDGQSAFSVSGDGSVKVWDVAKGKCVQTFLGYKSLCLSADGRYNVLGSWGEVSFWNMASGRCKRRLRVRNSDDHLGQVNSVCPSEDGRYVLSGCSEGTVRLWDIATGDCLQSLQQPASSESVCLSADGRYAISGCSNGNITAWFLDWELEENEAADWDEGARPYLDEFLHTHQPYAGLLPKDRPPTEEEVTRALTRQGRPRWSDDDFKCLLYTLGCAGYGWLRTEGVRRELQQMAEAL